MRIWIVDNDTALLRSLELLLIQRGHQVVCFDDPVAASTCVDHDPNPDILILDYAMPTLSGTDLLARCRHRLPKSCRVIMISGHTDWITPEIIDELGIDAFLPKPLDMERLALVLTRPKQNALDN